MKKWNMRPNPMGLGWQVVRVTAMRPVVVDEYLFKSDAEKAVARLAGAKSLSKLPGAAP